jgi:NTE family protein
MSYNYSNLVFEGGGVKGLAYVGALEVLEQKGILPQIKAVAGTSAGSIVGALLALGYTPGDIHTIMNELDFTKFEDGWDPLRIPFSYGLYKGAFFLNWMEEQIEKAPGKNLSKKASFADLQAAGGLDLHVFATDLNIKNVKEFSFATTPTVPVAEAVRASMSIPLFFKAWQFSNHNPDDHIYVDGGVAFNYPITTFDTPQNPENPQTLGFYLSNLSAAPAPNTLKFDELLTYVKVLFDTVLNTQNIDFEKEPSLKNRSVIINDLGISATDFKLTQAQKDALVAEGVKAATQFLGVSH